MSQSWVDLFNLIYLSSLTREVLAFVKPGAVNMWFKNCGGGSNIKRRGMVGGNFLNIQSVTTLLALSINVCEHNCSSDWTGLEGFHGVGADLKV